METREIKFRAWEPSTKSMHYDLSFYSDNGGAIMSKERPLIGGMLLQFTGLKDRNGKEIYQGDFIQNVTDDGKRLSIFEIRWQQSSCGFVKEREDGHTFTLEISKYFEVIGNIYENPELIN